MENVYYVINFVVYVQIKSVFNVNQIIISIQSFKNVYYKNKIHTNVDLIVLNVPIIKI